MQIRLGECRHDRPDGGSGWIGYWRWVISCWPRLQLQMLIYNYMPRLQLQMLIFINAINFFINAIINNNICTKMSRKTIQGNYEQFIMHHRQDRKLL